MRSRRAVGLTLIAIATACSERPDADSETPRAGTAGVEETVGITTRAMAIDIPIDASELPPVNSCPADGRWHPCSVQARLEQAGLAPRLAGDTSDTVSERRLTVRGTAFTVGRGELVLFFYPDRAARERDQARLDASDYVVWPRDPTSRGQRTLIVSENLLALLESSSSRQRERIRNAITAGPPQPAQ